MKEGDSPLANILPSTKAPIDRLPNTMYSHFTQEMVLIPIQTL
jgi:hypothetical protein